MPFCCSSAGDLRLLNFYSETAPKVQRKISVGKRIEICAKRAPVEPPRRR